MPSGLQCVCDRCHGALLDFVEDDSPLPAGEASRDSWLMLFPQHASLPARVGGRQLSAKAIVAFLECELPSDGLAEQATASYPAWSPPPAWRLREQTLRAGGFSSFAEWRGPLETNLEKWIEDNAAPAAAGAVALVGGLVGLGKCVRDWYKKPGSAEGLHSAIRQHEMRRLSTAANAAAKAAPARTAMHRRRQAAAAG
eukprot:TRINITY_DN114977_c0_g1_i1.p1 TRINITY_DN114977_c0_g1~~TRINITY_DN114977_c0_g1_i1.p1  ORF type:complete len:209 (+),score=43.88 TRINITY_DN114977_c0_g1_i1:36-629(+)